jgi:hypothetical protein
MTKVLIFTSNLLKIGSKEAGAKLYEMLQLGRSKPWKEIMGIMTGTPNMDTGAFREYFAPLEKWLIKQNKEDNNQVSLAVGTKNSTFMNHRLLFVIFQEQKLCHQLEKITTDLLEISMKL